jgi:YggT family protein
MGIICWVLQVYVLVLFARIILSWFPMNPGSALAGIHDFLRRLTDPVLEPLRKLLPPIGAGGVAIDLSPLIVVLGVQILVRIIC